MTRAQYSSTYDVLILGSGLAGSSVAHALATRGGSSLILEAGSAIAPKASGNPIALITPYLTDRPSPRELLYASGYNFSLQLLLKSNLCDSVFNQCGALQLPSTKRLTTLLQSSQPILGTAKTRRVSAQEANAISGIPINSEAFFTETAGCLDPRAFIQQYFLSDSKRIHIRFDSTVCDLRYSNNLWQAQTRDGATFSAPIAILCGAYETSSLKPTSWIPLEAIRGQTELVPTTPLLSSLKTAVCYGGYITPPHNGHTLIGALYRHSDYSELPDINDTRAILAEASEAVASLTLSPADSDPRVCFRTSTIDRIPYIGDVPDFNLMFQAASALRSGSNLPKNIPIQCLPRLYISAGHGSRGVLSCPIGAELIARLITKEPLGELSALYDIVSPSRLPYRVIRSRLSDH